jgi:hypothetical protein
VSEPGGDLRDSRHDARSPTSGEPARDVRPDAGRSCAGDRRDYERA